MKLRAFAAVALLLSAHIATAQTHVELSTERLAERPATSKAEGRAATPSVFDRFGAKSNQPTAGFWIIPQFELDDSPGQAKTTLWSIHNERVGAGTVDIAVIYSDANSSELLTDEFILGEDQTATFNLNLFPELVNPGGLSNGFIVVVANGPVSLDTFQVDPANDFATGDVAFLESDLCTEWQVRFLDFGGLSGGSELSFFINGPLGSDPADPPTIEGEVFDQAGNFLNAFTVRTELFSLDLPALDLVLGDTKFGSIELRIMADNLPAGIVSARHSAFGLFSVGLTGICRDGLFMF